MGIILQFSSTQGKNDERDLQAIYLFPAAVSIFGRDLQTTGRGGDAAGGDGGGEGGERGQAEAEARKKRCVEAMAAVVGSPTPIFNYRA